MIDSRTNPPALPPPAAGSPSRRAWDVSLLTANLLNTDGVLWDTLYSIWKARHDKLWQDSNPGEVLASLGNAAAGVLANFDAVHTFLSAQAEARCATEPGKAATLANLAAVAGQIPAYTTHEDGTVTLD